MRLAVPAEVLAGDAHAHVFAVERMQLLQVVEQDCCHLGQRWLGQRCATAQLRGDLAEDPGAALGGAADHDGVGAGRRQHGAGARGAVDVAIGDDRDAHGRLHRRHRVVLGLAVEVVLAAAAVHRQRRDAGGFGDAGDGERVAAGARVAGADLQRHRHRYCGDHGVEDAPDQRFIAQQGRAGGDVADLLRRAAHVDVDDVGAEIHVVARGLREHGGVVAGDLHADRRVLVGMVHAPA